MNNQHFPTLIKYIGISFITGAISHGFFSGTRQILTAIFGVFCFTVGTLLEKNTENTPKNILLSVGLAIAFGAVTGGLQHFPDSPERSVWIFPLGIIASIPLFSIIHREKITTKYIILLSTIGLILSMAFYVIIEKTPITGHSHTSTESKEELLIQEVRGVSDPGNYSDTNTHNTNDDGGHHNH